MNDIAIRVDSLEKWYRIGSRRDLHMTLRETLTDAFVAPFRRVGKLLRGQATGAAELDETFWALRDVSFEVKCGEVVGVIGRNGAGKTTLLKILSRITEPTGGHVEIRGRVGSLLEVGTGFHPELTGRENTYLNGAILGMKKADIDRKFDQIVAFAEIEKFLDTPVKHYSSGMYVRLAFAVAAHLEPDVLLVDEVLAVGDAVFQKKCLGKMGDVAKEGRTVLFVSHNMQAVRSLCGRCHLLESGRLTFSGAVGDCIDRYLSKVGKSSSNEVEVASLERPSVIRDESLRILRVKLDTGTGQAIVKSGQPLQVEMTFRSSEPLDEVVFGFSVETTDNVRILECRSIDSYAPFPLHQPGEYQIRCAIRHNLLAPGIYGLSVGARCANKGLDYVPDALTFEVHSVERYESLWLEAPSGLVRMQSEWSRPASVLVQAEREAQDG